MPRHLIAAVLTAPAEPVQEAAEMLATAGVPIME